MPKTIEIKNLDYNDAAKLISSSIINQNHDLLDKTINNIEDSILICENPEIELIPIRNEIFYIRPEFLENPKEEIFIRTKNEIDLYIEDYKFICDQMNNLVDKTSESLRKIEKPVNELKIEIKKIKNQFEENIKNLCIPLISEQEGLDDIDKSRLSEEQKDIFDEDKLNITYEIDMFKKESNNLNKYYNKLFKGLYSSVKVICNGINAIPPIIVDFQKEVEEGMDKSEKILENFNSEKDYENFKVYFDKLKDSLLLIKDKKVLKEKEMEKIINNLVSQYELKKNYFETLKNESSKIIANLTKKSDLIKNKILEIRHKLNKQPIEIPQINIADIIVDNIVKSLEESKTLVKVENNNIQKGIKEFKINFIEKTSLDLLFIMDNTGSMEAYFDKMKASLIDIIDKIQEKKPEIEIDIGYIGYKDVKEINNKECKIISFTKDYNFIKNEIDNITIGGGDDTAEDVAWGFEQANKLKWTSNAKFAILIADAPCHGLKYHDKNLIDNFKNGVVGRKNIEESIKEMIEKQISLFCIKLNETTDIMHGIFEKIYNEKGEENECAFLQVKMNSPDELVEEVVKNSSKIYDKYRLK